MWKNKLTELQKLVRENQKNIEKFLFDIVAIPSMDGQLKEVGERIAEEMAKLNFKNIRFDKMGNILGEIGDGDEIAVYDSHIDTVGLGDPSEWKWDPFKGKIEDGFLYARGACDEKGSTPGMIYGLGLAAKLGLLEGYKIYYFGNMEEWCDGIAPNALVEVEGIKPNWVLIGEPTKMQVYRGHKGRIELKITSKGKSAHAASNYLGDNAIYKLLPVIDAISKLQPELGDHPILGPGRITVTDIRAETPSINAVPNACEIFLDRRLTLGEDKNEAIEQIKSLIPKENREKGDISIEILQYREPSYTGFVFEVEKYYPPWLLEEDHPLVRAGQLTREAIGLSEAPTGTWDFSTNGTYWTGKAAIPSIGFAPGDEIDAHTVNDRVKIKDVVKSTEFYALFPAILRENKEK